jgi:hypothetical protein
MAHHRQLTQSEISSDRPNHRHLEHMAVRAATRLGSPLQGPNLPVLVPARDILSAATQIMSWPPGQGSLRFAAGPRSANWQSWRFFLRVIGHPHRRTGRRQHDPNTYAGQVSRRLSHRTRNNRTAIRLKSVSTASDSFNICCADSSRMVGHSEGIHLAGLSVNRRSGSSK